MNTEHAGGTPFVTDTDALARRIVGEYFEMPGLSVTTEQARCLWRLDRATCEAVLKRLTEDGRLRLTKGGRYVAGNLERA